MGALDFAGGIVIHTTAGVGAFVLALMLGKPHFYIFSLLTFVDPLIFIFNPFL
jgi:ammonia channel protein AmtB